MRSIILTATMASAMAFGSAGAGSVGASAQYGGLGATPQAFYANNTHGAGFPPLGVAYYKVDRIRAGRVVAYHVVINARPAFSNRERMVLLAGVNLPRDAIPTGIDRSTCIIWRSKTLHRLVGTSYAVATTITGTKSAEMSAEVRARC